YKGPRFGEVPEDGPQRLSGGWAVEPANQPHHFRRRKDRHRPCREPGPATHEQHQHPAGQENPDDLRFSPGRDQRAADEDYPEQTVGLERQPDKLESTASNNRDDSGTDTVEGALHPG